MKKILLIEDNQEIAIALSQALAQTYAVAAIKTGVDAIRRVRHDDYDLAVLDLNLPDMPGLEVCQELRQQTNQLSILVLTAETNILTKIRLLDAGADDYLTKPFSLGELKARLRVLQRRTVPVSRSRPKIVVGDLALDKTTHRVEREGMLIPLRRKEFTLLECLMENAGAVVTRPMLGDYAWRGSDKPWTNTIDVHIKHLRDKIDRPFEQSLIRTVHGLGYKLEVRSQIKAKEEN